MIPSFMVMSALGWIDEPRALYVPGAASALGIFLMRQYIASAIPRDAAGRRTGWTAAASSASSGAWCLPLLGPALGTLGLVTFINSWNNFVNPLVVMRSVEHYTLPLALRSMQSPNNTEWGARDGRQRDRDAAAAGGLLLQRPPPRRGAHRRRGCVAELLPAHTGTT
jgi:multiple sugar transport system permease protein